ncbi:hypothetical protein TSAR_006208 [Trichomalopsis sarcophagae]|uniref:Uncharacterized protein n=1 Tax=Trichomalopsis sarcophagae TaxID=543379 RepID=A0A232EL38_9HYME|nr:hypothetical protein TSAR_006208 [Trichomalopsis sarcophagae]
MINALANAGDSTRRTLACTSLCGTYLYSNGSLVYAMPRDGFSTLQTLTLANAAASP